MPSLTEPTLKTPGADWDVLMQNCNICEKGHSKIEQKAVTEFEEAKRKAT